MKNTVIPQFMSFCIYEMHSLISGFKFASQFSLGAHSCHIDCCSQQPFSAVSFCIFSEITECTTSLSDV